MAIQVDPNKLRAIDLIVQGLNVEEIAKQLNISSRTLRYWKHDKDFATELKKRFSHVRDELDAAFNPILKRIQALANELLDGVAAFMRSSDVKLQERGMRRQIQLLKCQ
jgi:transposase-like protein